MKANQMSVSESTAEPHYSRTVSAFCVAVKKRIRNLCPRDHRGPTHAPTKTKYKQSQSRLAPPHAAPRDARRRERTFRSETKQKAVHKRVEPCGGANPANVACGHPKKKGYEKLWCVGNETTPKVCCDLLLSSAWP